DVFEGTHTGYLRLPAKVRPIRTIVLDHRIHGLIVFDRFDAASPAPIEVEIPLHLAANAEVERQGPTNLFLRAAGRCFELAWEARGRWTLDLTEARISPSYGIARPTCRLAWRYEGSCDGFLLVSILPQGVLRQHPIDWSSNVLKKESQANLSI